MNQQEQATQHAAIFQDTINGTNDPTPWPVTMWASSGDTIWTAGTARTAGEDSVGMIYDPGDTIVHRNTIAGDVTRATESFAIRPADGQSPMDAMLAGIEQWNHRHPDRWDTVATPGQYRMTDPTTGRQLPMGWSASLAAAASAAGRLDPDLLQASLMQNAVEHEPRPCVFFLEDNGYDLMVFSWHRNQQGLFDAMSFKHLQYDDLSMQVTTISHSEDMSESFPAKTMSDGELLTQSRVYRDVTEGTFDAYSYQTVERKQRFISQLMSSKSPAREAADLDADVVTLANIKALATGDPDIQRRMTLENEINQLKLLRASWAQQKADTRRDINQQLQPRIEGIHQAIREKTDDKPLASKALNIHQTARMNGKWEGMTINGRPVGDRQTACRLLHQAAHQAHDGDTIAEYDGLPVIARRAATTGRITLAVKAVHEHESGTEMPGPYLTGPSSIVSQLDRIVKNMATDPGKLTERLADAERELAAAQETLAEPFAHEDEYRQKQAELERLTSKPDEPRETESRDQETKERSAGMPLTTENARRLLEQDHDVTEVTQGGNAMGHYLEARLTDGRAVQIDFHDNPAWKDTDRLAGRIEVSYANRPQAEWQYDDNDMADREHTVIDPADPAAGKTLAKAVEGWERAGGLHTARAAGTSHLAANQPPEEYAYRWRKPGDPDRHIAYLSTAFDRDQAMKARENAGYVVTKVDEDPAVLYEQHRKASCMRASHILERYESPDQDAVRILHGIVGEVNAHDPENDIATYLAYPSDKVVQIAGDGLTSADIAEKREMGGWDPRKDPLMRINAQGDWTGITQQQADQIVWDNRDEILTRASYDSELSTWTLHQLDQLKEPQPTQSLDRDRPEPDHKAPAQADSTTKRHGPRL